jgi:hypothetical protein
MMRLARRAVKSVSGSVAGVILASAVAACNTDGGAPTADFASDSPPEVIADSLMGLWIDSLGGMATYEAFRSASYTITTVIYDTLSGRVKRARPRYAWIKKGPYGLEARIERWEGNDFIVQGFNGRDEWATLNGAFLPDTAKDWRETRYVTGDVSYWPGLPYKLRDNGVFLHYRGQSSRPGTELREDPATEAVAGAAEYHAVGVTFGEGIGDHRDTWQYYFEPGEGFPTEVTYIEEGREDINRVVWGSTERAGELGYPVVVRRDWITASGKRTKALIVSDFVVNPEIDQSLFERPET